MAPGAPAEGAPVDVVGGQSSQALRWPDQCRAQGGDGATGGGHQLPVQGLLETGSEGALASSQDVIDQAQTIQIVVDPIQVKGIDGLPDDVHRVAHRLHALVGQPRRSRGRGAVLGGHHHHPVGSQVVRRRQRHALPERTVAMERPVDVNRRKQ